MLAIILIYSVLGLVAESFAKVEVSEQLIFLHSFSLLMGGL